MKIGLIILVVLGGVVLLVWLGLKIEPGPLPPYPGEEGEVKYIPLPKDLPAPVDRFYREVYGEEIPQIDSIVITGKARLRVNGITFPGRFRFTHQTGKDYRHYIEATIFQLPLMRVNERYLDGVSRMELPFDITEGEPKINQAANLALWAEAMWFPSIFLTDPNVYWEEVDDTSAILVVPFDDAEERFQIDFDPDSGLLSRMESMRYKEAESQDKTLWINIPLEWEEVDGYMIPSAGAVRWEDENSPWAVFRVDELVINSDIREYIRAVGP